MNWYLHVLKNYFVFKGRSRRKEYWMFVLYNFIISLGLAILEIVLSIPMVLTGFYTLFIFIPSLTLTIRRFHDIGKSAWWVLICFVPLIGPILMIIFACLDSQPSSNKYGHIPK